MAPMATFKPPVESRIRACHSGPQVFTTADWPLLTEPLAIVVGAEGSGLSRLVRDRCDVLAGIPIDSRVESLNASVAAALALFEVARVRASD